MIFFRLLPTNPIEAEKPKVILAKPPEGFVVVANGCSMKMLEALSSTLRWDSDGKLDYASLNKGWWEAFNMLKSYTVEDLKKVGIEMEKHE